LTLPRSRPQGAPGASFFYDNKEMTMLTKQDQERLDKATQAANLLQRDVLDLSRSDNPLLADIGYSLLDDVVSLHNRLERLTVVTREEATG
jgi:hypothetical protein